MERLTKRFDGWVMREGCHGPCRTCNGAKCADIFPMIDRLAAYEDSGLTPDEVAEYQHLCETYVEAGLDSKFVQICIDATRGGVTIEQIMKLGSSNDPLTLEELREMDGEPVWIEWGGHPQAGWALVRVWSKASNVVYLTYHNGNTDLLRFVLNDGGKIYRRKPEEGTV